MNIFRTLQNLFFRILFSEANEIKRREEEDQQREEKEETVTIEEKTKEPEIPDEEQNKILAQRLAKAMDYAVRLPYYQRGHEKYRNGKSKTFCNVLARKFLLGNFDYGLYDNKKDPKYHWLNYDIQQVFAGMPMTTALYGKNATTAYGLAKKAIKAKKVEQLSPQQAQEEANKGIPIWIVYKGHEALVYPNKAGYDETHGPKIAQAGLFNFSNSFIDDGRS